MILSYSPAQISDAEAVIRFNQDLIDQYEDITKIDYDFVMRWVRKKVETHIESYCRVLCDGELAGFFYFHPQDGKMELDDLFIFPEYQNRGIGTAVMEHCLAGTSLPVFLFVFLKNERAVSLYKKLGFAPVQKVSDSRCIMECIAR